MFSKASFLQSRQKSTLCGKVLIILFKTFADKNWYKAQVINVIERAENIELVCCIGV